MFGVFRPPWALFIVAIGLSAQRGTERTPRELRAPEAIVHFRPVEQPSQLCRDSLEPNLVHREMR
eukprot:14610487-Alexandrium_andersonii.AAC.1